MANGSFLQTYLTQIKEISPTAKEQTFRSALENLFKELQQQLAKTNKNFNNIHFTHEPNNDKSGLGAPDFQVKLGGGDAGGLTLGYIENKRVEANLQGLIDEANKDDKAQLAKYLKLNPNLILTDYLRFWRVGKNEKGKIEATRQIQICTLDELANLTKTAKKEGVSKLLHEKENELLDFFALFFNATPKPINTAAEFANALAIHTKELNDSLWEMKTNRKINTLYKAFKDILYKNLEFEEFCDNFAQTLTYALFLARLNDNKGEKIDLYNVKKFIPNSFPLIRAMSGFLDNLDELSGAKWIVEEILNIINHINIEAITKELNEATDKNLRGGVLHKDLYLHFYETFLSQYNPKLRERRGVYYTPFAVVSFIINAIDTTLRQEFGQEKGLGSAIENEKITLLDFATGTGTFLLEAFRKALENTPKNSPKYKPTNLLSRFSGFELLIAPYTVAHLKISQSFKEEFNAPLNEDEKLQILLTNTIYNISTEEERYKRESVLTPTGVELEQEFLEAQDVKNSPILIITGNPPYSGKSANKGIFEKEVREAYAKEPNTNQKLKNEKNPKWLLDDYVKFIRFAESKIERQEQGIIAIITNHGFLDNPTFRGMRFHLLNSFEKIYIVDLHGNVKRKEKAPDGGKDDNVFDIQQGVCISIFVKTSKKKEALAELFCYDLFGKQSEKYNFLLENDLNSLAWRKLNPQAPSYLFTPQNEALRTEYDKGWSVKDIFKVSSVGVVSGRDDLCFSKSDTQQSLQEFKERIAKFMELEAEAARKEFNLPQDSRDWKIQYAQKELRETNNNPSNYVKCHYRPFDIRYTYYTGKSKGFHCMPRGEVMRHFLVDNIGLNTPRQLKTSQNEWNHILVQHTIIDQALTSGGNGAGVVHPLYVKDEANAKQNATLFEDETPKGRVENFTDEFRAFVDAKYGERFSPEQILGYIYAVLYHKDYREKYLDFLKTDFPKIPFVQSKEKFLQLSELGTELIDLHLMRERETRKW